jgi:hypothetical protein
MTLWTQHHRPASSCRNNITILFIIVSLIGGGVPGFSAFHGPVVLAADAINPWNLTLHLSETSGTGYTLVFGVKPDASNGQDQYDIPEPPAPPQFPYILAWFATPFSRPFDRLQQEYKQYPSSRSMWNLSVLWVAQPGNTSPPTISITWDPQSVGARDHVSLLLYENSTVVADMLTDYSYSFSTGSALHRFKIISESNASDGSSAGKELPVIPLSAGVIVIIVLLLVVIWYRTKKT